MTLLSRPAPMLVLLLSCQVSPSATPTVQFNRDIRPIMSDTCFRCHGPDSKTRMAGMRLDIREAALKKTRSGITPIVPGDPDKSAIVQRVFTTDGKIMPPADAHKELTAKQKDTIRRWVAEGAVYQGHWAYQPVRRPAVPEVRTANAVLSNPIDAFIQDRLAREGLKPSPEADKRTLLRRVTFDLTGLPPTQEEMEAFAADTSADAYRKVVDRLLASDRYAETRAMHWLDAVRYADSAGFHGDNLWPAWPYRDYVLRAIRENMPFDRFTREQIAGDLMPDATVDQKIASAYNRLSRASAEGGLQPKEYLAKYGADRVRTTTTVWLGATMGCAECHDHKFDPFTAKDFYSFKAFFSDIRETGLIPDRGMKAWGAKLLLASPEQKQRLKEMDEKLVALRAGLDDRVEEAKERRWVWEEKLLKQHAKGELAWKYQRPVSAKAANGATLTVHNDDLVESRYYLNGSLTSERKLGAGVVIAGGENPDNETYTVQVKPGAGVWKSIGIDVQQDDSLLGNRMARGADKFTLSEVESAVTLPSGETRKLAFSLATTGQFGERPENTGTAAIDGDPRTGWSVGFNEARNSFLALRFTEPVTTTADSLITIRMRHEGEVRRATIGRFRLALSAAEYSFPEGGESSRKAKAKNADPNISTLAIPVDLGIPSDVLTALQVYEEERSEDQAKLVNNFYAWSTPEFQETLTAIALLENERNQLEASIPHVLATESVRPRETRLLRRGNFLDDGGEVVEPAIPAVFGKLETNGGRATRLDLANWIVSKENPLTARVFVNRVWRQLFGTGLSKVMEDVGSQGEWPTHTELIDWLAAEFVEPSVEAEGTHAWDMKHLVRTVVMSHTYRQASEATKLTEEKDPENRLLAHQSRFRVEAETVHDVALSVAGLLDNRFGGPSVRPRQPEGYMQAMNFPKREYSESKGTDQYRRALYTQWQRTFLHPTLLTFDAPTREECTVNRVNSNTPLQALVLLNDPVFVEAARAFAQRIVAEGGAKFGDQLDYAFRRALNRAPEKQERRILEDLHKRARAEFRKDGESARKLLSIGEAPLPADADPAEIASMTAVARTILNMHETITRN